MEQSERVILFPIMLIQGILILFMVMMMDCVKEENKNFKKPEELFKFLNSLRFRGLFVFEIQTIQ